MRIIIIIVILIIIVRALNKKTNHNTFASDDDDRRKYYKFNNSSVVSRHYEILDKTKSLYSKVYQSGDYHSKDAYEFEALCIEDISLAEDFVRLCRECDQPIPSYPSFKQLAVFYEKQGNFQLAVPLCDEAIRLGFSDDGTKDGMQGRLVRLEKKYNNK